MNITVIGAGPAGLYFAAAAARHIPNCRVRVYEKGHADADNGRGYVCDQQITGFLGAIDKQAPAQLNIATRPTWNVSYIEKPPVQVGRGSTP